MERMASSDTLQRRGLMFILSSPSGAGKTTISRMLLDRDSEIALSVSATTRPIRPGEVAVIDHEDRIEAGLTAWGDALSRRELATGLVRFAIERAGRPL